MREYKLINSTCLKIRNALEKKFKQIIAIISITIFSNISVVVKDAKTIIQNYLAIWNAHDAKTTANKLDENVRYYNAFK